MDNQDLKARKIRRLERQLADLYYAAYEAYFSGNQPLTKKIEMDMKPIGRELIALQASMDLCCRRIKEMA